jgi:hypothetical protein
VPIWADIQSGHHPITPDPTTAWTTGQHITTADDVDIMWDGTKWIEVPAGPPPPTFGNVTPFFYPVDTGLVAITVNGSGFTNTDVIQIDLADIASTTFVSATQLTGEVQTTGQTPHTASMTVLGPGGRSVTSGVEFT